MIQPTKYYKENTGLMSHCAQSGAPILPENTMLMLENEK
jgi:hypothetical protein